MKKEQVENKTIFVSFAVLKNHTFSIFYVYHPSNRNKELADFDHTFEYSKVDSSHILMPQRRERVWGSSSVKVDDEAKYSLDMKMSMQRMKSSMRFGLSHLLQDDLPEGDPPTGGQCQNRMVDTIQFMFQAIYLYGCLLNH